MSHSCPTFTQFHPRPQRIIYWTLNNTRLPPVCLSVCLSLCLSVCLSVSLLFWRPWTSVLPERKLQFEFIIWYLINRASSNKGWMSLPPSGLRSVPHSAALNRLTLCKSWKAGGGAKLPTERMNIIHRYWDLNYLEATHSVEKTICRTIFSNINFVIEAIKACVMRIHYRQKIATYTLTGKRRLTFGRKIKAIDQGVRVMQVSRYLCLPAGAKRNNVHTCTLVNLWSSQASLHSWVFFAVDPGTKLLRNVTFGQLGSCPNATVEIRRANLWLRLKFRSTEGSSRTSIPPEKFEIPSAVVLSSLLQLHVKIAGACGSDQRSDFCQFQWTGDDENSIYDSLQSVMNERSESPRRFLFTTQHKHRLISRQQSAEEEPALRPTSASIFPFGFFFFGGGVEIQASFTWRSFLSGKTKISCSWLDEHRKFCVVVFTSATPVAKSVSTHWCDQTGCVQSIYACRSNANTRVEERVRRNFRRLLISVQKVNRQLINHRVKRLRIPNLLLYEYPVTNESLLQLSHCLLQVLRILTHFHAGITVCTQRGRWMFSFALILIAQHEMNFSAP